MDVFGAAIDLFWVGVLGSLSVELMALAGLYDSGNTHGKYRKPGFYVTRLSIALLGGFLVKVYGVNSAPAALQIGASTPAILATLAAVKRPADPT